LTHRIIGPAVVAVLIVGSSFAQKLEVNLASESLIESRLASGQVRGRQRQAVIRGLFADAGCSAEEQPVGRHSGNVVCTLAGDTGSTIAAGGHFDFVDAGQGIVDDWSGASLLPSLYEALKTHPRRHTYVFIAFTDEEQGLVGSARYIKKLTADQKARIHAFVNLECLGLNPVKYWANRSTPALVQDLADVAAGLGDSLQAVNVDKVGDDDTHSFLNAKIPVISIHSITPDTFGILHSARDKMAAIDFKNYYEAYKLAANYLAYLDAKVE